jgi:nucleotide-binding universal stress UspA family protein
MNIRHILVPVDFSESTPAVVSEAVELAEKFLARLTLYHVIHPVFAASGEMDYTLNQSEIKMYDQAREKLAELAAPIRPRVDAAVRMQTGIPWECIVNHAAQNDVDLIVTGTHGRSGLKHLWLGSVAERVVQHAPCCVLVVRTRPAPKAARAARRAMATA